MPLHPHAWELSCLPPGTEIGSWRLLELRGQGAYGTVYRAERRGEEGCGAFALKLARHPADPRFEREAELLSRLCHPNIPALRDRGLWAHSAGLVPFLVMDWVEGVPLYAWGAGRTLTSRQVMQVLAQAARALAATHEADGVHRDVSGANILVRPEDAHAVLIDFGAGSFRGAAPLTEEVLPPGTPPYRSPEALQFRWRFWRERGAHYAPGPADDVYALGVTAYRLVTGFYPPAEVRLEGSGAKPRVRVPAENLVTLCPLLAKLLRQMLSKKPSARGSASQVARALEQAAASAGPGADQPITRHPSATGVSRRPGLWLAAAAGIVTSLLLPGAWTVWRHPAWLAEDPMETTGLAQDALPVSGSVQAPASGPERIGLDVPKKLLPGQARPPCRKREIEINGGCWVLPREATPPCGDRNYEWRGVCYYPVLAPVPSGNSEQP
ncbi:Serine/threonine protein kinase [Stigmatella aurantiaca]|uniref:Serine/threonine protein kinase n=1 Tax=Stigmatella aurantiaca TaxID=41 RepID=A0A1H7LSJ8_STIAU|nr:serine/threonine-protein kinase [Stigmatella aurantiaca]SEL01910.1 Serine/threonine protein kinase [Stigmatella aurantiaca]